MKGQTVITCPKCAGNKIKVLPMRVAIFASASCLMWIPIIGWIIGPLLFLLWIVMLFVGGKAIQCEECKHVFNASKQQYKEYQNYSYDSSKDV